MTQRGQRRRKTVTKNKEKDREGGGEDSYIFDGLLSFCHSSNEQI